MKAKTAWFIAFMLLLFSDVSFAGKCGPAVNPATDISWQCVFPIRVGGLVQKAAALDPSSPQVYWSMGYVYLHRRQYQEAAEAARQAISLAPNYADGYALLAFISNFLGKSEDAIRFTRRAMSLNPYYTYQYPLNLGKAYYALGKYSDAVKAMKETLEHNENSLYARLYLASSYVRLGQQEDAVWEIEQVDILSPGTTITHLASTFPVKDKAQLNLLLGDLREAGLPE